MLRHMLMIGAAATALSVAACKKTETKGTATPAEQSATPDANPMEAMLNADIVVAYNSTSLVEALGLGRPVISLCGGSIPRGFAGSFDFADVFPVMPHVSSPQDLIKVLQDRASEEGIEDQMVRA